MVYWAVYDSGSVFSPAVLDITEEDLLKKFVAVSTSRIKVRRSSDSSGGCPKGRLQAH